MLISRISLRLLPSEELVGDPFPDACVRGEIRAEMQRAEIAWRQQFSGWYDDGRLAVGARASDSSLLQQILDGLRNPGPVST
jgi:hypothetical protein